MISPLAICLNVSTPIHGLLVRLAMLSIFVIPLLKGAGRCQMCQLNVPQVETVEDSAPWPSQRRHSALSLCGATPQAFCRHQISLVSVLDISSRNVFS